MARWVGCPALPCKHFGGGSIASRQAANPQFGDEVAKIIRHECPHSQPSQPLENKNILPPPGHNLADRTNYKITPSRVRALPTTRQASRTLFVSSSPRLTTFWAVAVGVTSQRDSIGEMLFDCTHRLGTGAVDRSSFPAALATNMDPRPGLHPGDDESLLYVMLPLLRASMSRNPTSGHVGNPLTSSARRGTPGQPFHFRDSAIKKSARNE